MSEAGATHSGSREVTDARLQDYLDRTARALAAVRIVPPERSHLRRLAEDFLRMAQSYHSDALHFRDKGEHVTAFAAVSYAHGWLDAGARMGLFDVGGDDRLFTLAE